METSQTGDASIVATFKHHAIKNDLRSLKEGRPIFDDIEVCVLRYPGSVASSVHPAMEMSHWAIDPFTGEQTKVTYAERFTRQYQQFKSHAQQTKSGTPLEHAAFLTEARRAELRALNIYTIEALADVEGQPLKNLGPYGRDLKNKAIAYIAESKLAAPNLELVAQLEQIKARNAILEEDVKALRARGDEGEFSDMSLEQLSQFVAANTGHAPQGDLSRKTLVRMASDARPQKVA
jgi:hypothetical protein